MYPGEQASAVLIVTVPASAGFAATERVSQALPCGERVAVKLALPEGTAPTNVEEARTLLPGGATSHEGAWWPIILGRVQGIRQACHNNALARPP